MKTNRTIAGWLMLLALSTLNLQIPTAFAQGTAFTYQGRLNSGTNAANGSYDLTFALFVTNSGGSAVAGPKTNSVTGVTNGLFAVTLDFGNSVFTGSNCWLEIEVRSNGAASFTTLSPRQPILPMPYAIMANSASNLLGTLPLAQLGAGTANISITGNAATAVNGVVTTGTYADPGWITSLAGSKISGSISGNAITATTASNVVSGIAITNAFITNSIFAGNGFGLTNLSATNLVGTIPDARLSTNVATLNGTNVFRGTNTYAGVTVLTNWNNLVNGTFAGIGFGLTNLNPANLASGGVISAVSLTNPANIFAGNGFGLTNLSATNLVGTIPDARLSTNVALLNGTNMFTGTNTFAGVLIATNWNNLIYGTFAGNGGGLTNIYATNLVGTIPDARLSTNVALLNGTNLFTGTNTFAGVTVLTNWNNLIYGTFAGNGGGLTNIYATNLVGTIPDARLSTNVATLNGTNLFTGTNTFAGVILLTNWNNLIYGTFAGNGGGLTNIYATNLVGTIPDARLSTNVATLNGTNLFTGTNTFAGVTVLTNWNNLIYGTFAGNGGGLTNIYATNLVGTIPDARLSTNVVLLNGTNVFTGTNIFAGVTFLTNANNVFKGDGSGLVNLPGANANTAYLNGTNLFIGTNTFAGVVIATNEDNQFAGDGSKLRNLPGANANTAYLNGTNLFIGTNTFAGVVIATNEDNQFAGDGSKLRNLPGANANTAYLNGTNLFIGTNTFAGVLIATNPANQIVSTFISISGTNVVAPLTVVPRVPVSALGSAGTATSPDAVAVAGRYAYVASQSGSLQIFDVSNPAMPVPLGSLATGGNLASVAVAGRYAYVVNRADNTLKVVDVSNPNGPTGGPVIVGSVTTGTGSGPNYIAVAGRFAYVVNMTGNTLQIFDVNNPANPVLAASVGTGNGPSCVAVAGRYAYVVNQSPVANTLQIFDVGDPTLPLSVGSVATGNSPTSVAVSGRYAYVVNQGAIGLQAFDVSSAGSPVIVGSTPTGPGPISVAVAGRYAYVVTQPASLQVFDVSNPGLMSLVGSVGTGNSPRSVAVSGRYAYVVNQAGNNLQTFDLGGAYVQQLEAGTIETGSLQTRDTVTVGNNLDVRGGLTVSGSARVSGGLGAGLFTGSGAGLTGLNAGNITSGTLPNAQLPPNVATLDALQIFTGANTFNPVSGAPFAVLSTIKVDSLNADLLDGFHAANTAGNIPVNNGTLNSSLNADLLDGMHSASFVQLSADQTFTGQNIFNPSGGVAPFAVGNSTKVNNLNADLLDGATTGGAAGNIPLNNSVLNSTLNADLLDGLHSTAFVQLSADQTFSGINHFNNPLNSFFGSGANLTALNAAYITSGTLADGQLSANVPRLNANQAFTGMNAFNPNGGVAPFIVGNSTKVDWLNADLLDGLHSASFAQLSANQTFTAANTFSAGVGIGSTAPSSGLDVAGDTRARGLLRSGSESGTSETPSPAGLVIRRINSTSTTAGQILARTDVLTLERDGTTSGLLIRYPASGSSFTISCVGLNNAGTVVTFHRALVTPFIPSTAQIFSDAQRVVHAEISFGDTISSTGHFTQVVLDRVDDGSTSNLHWVGTLTSTYNQ